MSLQLKPNNRSNKANRILLVILDGVGETNLPETSGNAIAKANLPNLKPIWNNSPSILLQAHGTAVGMPSDEDMGNSEVGHNALGAGRVFDQGAKLVNESIAKGQIFQGDVWKNLISNCNQHSSTLHFIGLISDGNVHSHIDHLESMLEAACKSHITRIRIHALLDGRDVPEKSALIYIKRLESFLSKLMLTYPQSNLAIASGGGRMSITMDRYEADWSMVKRGWDHHVLARGRSFPSTEQAIETLYKEDPKAIDQYLPPFVLSGTDGKPLGEIIDNDSVIFFNFRGDRSIEISRAFTEENFTYFNRERFPKVKFAGMMQYDGDLKIPKDYLVPPPTIDKTISEYLVGAKMKQYALSETQKFGHVTFFWNGNRSGAFDQNLETYEEIPSDIIPFDQKPEMKASEITDALVKTLIEKDFDFLRVNYANGDMVGHTGNLDATVKGLEFLDNCIKRVIDACYKTDTTLLITADHGNADEMYQLDKKGNVLKSENGNPISKTSHTLNPVRLSLVDPKNRFAFATIVSQPGLGNVAATILDLFGFEPPEGYLPSLLQES